MSDNAHDFDQPSELCSKHGLTLNPENLCTACEFESAGTPPETYGRYDKQSTGIPPGESLASMNRRDYRARQRQKKEEAQEKNKLAKEEAENAEE